MTRFHYYTPLACMLIAFSLFHACSDEVKFELSKNSDSQITQRTIQHDSVFEHHNAFILWLFDKYLDSTEYYLANDVVDFANFVSRKEAEFRISPTIYYMDELITFDDKLIFPSPYYVKNEGFSLVYGSYTAAEYDSLYVVLDSVANAVELSQSEASVLEIITRGKSRIDAVNFTHEDGLLNTLTQAYYSLSLMYEYGDIGPSGYVDPCIFIAALSDVSAYLYFEELGDLDPGSPMYNFARTAVAGISIASFISCN